MEVLVLFFSVIVLNYTQIIHQHVTKFYGTIRKAILQKGQLFLCVFEILA